MHSFDNLAANITRVSAGFSLHLKDKEFPPVTNSTVAALRLKGMYLQIANKIFLTVAPNGVQLQNSCLIAYELADV